MPSTSTPDPGDELELQFELAAPPDLVFEAFTARLGAFWPLSYTFSGPELAMAALEPRVGGEWYERDVCGARLSWGNVLAYEPPRRLVLGFGIGPDRRPAPPERASEVELRFERLSGDRTRLQLRHRAFERHGEQAAAYRTGMASERGWPLIIAALRREVSRMVRERAARELAAARCAQPLRVLLAVDGSPSSHSALDVALARPWPATTVMRVLSVAEATLSTPVFGTAFGLSEQALLSGLELNAQRTAEELAAEIAQRACDRLCAAGLRVDKRTRLGSPGREIVEEARAWHASLIWVGCRPHSGLARLLLGSTADHVVHHAPCSVEIARGVHRDDDTNRLSP